MDQVFEITVLETGEKFPCKENQFILQAMIRAGCGPIYHGCCGGGCGVCKMQLVAGKVDRVKKMSRAHISPKEEQEKKILLCCVQPRADVTVAQVNTGECPKEIKV